MTTKQIEARKMLENVKFDAALAIRKILDDAKKAAGKDATDDMEEEILALVTEEPS